MRPRHTALLAGAVAALLSGCLATLPPQAKLSTLPLPAVPPSSLASQLPAAQAGAKAATLAATDARGQAGQLATASAALTDTAASLTQARAAAVAAGPPAAAVLPPLEAASASTGTAAKAVARAAPSAEQYLALTARTQELAARLQTADEAVRARDVANAQNLAAIAARDDALKARDAELADLRTTLALAPDAEPGAARRSLRDLQAQFTARDAELADLRTTLALAPDAEPGAARRSLRDLQAQFTARGTLLTDLAAALGLPADADGPAILSAAKQLVADLAAERNKVVLALRLLAGACFAGAALVLWLTSLAGWRLAAGLATIAAAALTVAQLTATALGWYHTHTGLAWAAVGTIVAAVVGALIYQHRAHLSATAAADLATHYGEAVKQATRAAVSGPAADQVESAIEHAGAAIADRATTTSTSLIARARAGYRSLLAHNPQHLARLGITTPPAA